MGAKVLVGEEGTPQKARRLPPSGIAAWRWIGWFGVALAVAGLGDFVLAWVPLRFGSPDWEFGTVASTFAGLPLITMGLAAMLGAAFVTGRRWMIAALAWSLMGWAALLLVAYVLFLTTAPIALDATTGAAQLGIKKAIAKTTMLTVVFTVVYVAGSLGALRHLRTGGPREGA